MVADAILSGAKSMGLGGGGNFGRSARLYKALVSPGIARSAGSDFDLTIDPFLLSVSASALPGGDPDQIEAVMNDNDQSVPRQNARDHEVSRAIKQVKAQYIYSGEGVFGPGILVGQHGNGRQVAARVRVHAGR